ncbi:MAG TPA: class I SAM-dependent methyltransferase family protein [Nitrososphaerales archaeon]|nr:class I SAM-dependent methyltransferase family protein [Nitrososphaerales archaeon]
MLKEALRDRLSENEIASLSSSFDVIGNIVVIKIPPELSSKEKMIGEQILQRMKNVQTVLKQDSNVQGEYRTRNVAFIAGEEKYETIYKESGLLFRVNVGSAYFSPRLSTERLRIRSLVSDGEHIFNMFAGIGTFSLVIAKTKSCEIESVDKNPEAIRLAIESLKLNKRIKGTVRPVLDDAKDFALGHKGTFDRILMPLPERSAEFLSAAMVSAKDQAGPVVHYYVHVSEEEFYDEKWITSHLDEMELPRKYEVTKWKRVREVGPRFIQAVADIVLL